MRKQPDLPTGIRWAKLARLQPWFLLTKYPSRFTRSAFAFVNSTIAMAVIGLGAWYTSQPLIFPSLGPTAFAFFFRPSASSSSPRNAVLGHTSGILVGWLCAHSLQGLLGPLATTAISLGGVAALMIAADIVHPPAASTALFVSMGMISTPSEMLTILVSILLLTVQGFVINRLSGISFPIWRAPFRGRSEDLIATALQTETHPSRSDVYASLADQIVQRKKPVRTGDRPRKKPGP